MGLALLRGYYVISIRAPHAGSDILFRGLDDPEKAFQSALPMRGATALTS